MEILLENGIKTYDSLLLAIEEEYVEVQNARFITGRIVFSISLIDQPNQSRTGIASEMARVVRLCQRNLTSRFEIFAAITLIIDLCFFR